MGTEQLERDEKLRWVDYYTRFAEYAQPDSPYREQTLDQLAEDRYQTLMDYEQEEVPRQMNWLAEHDYNPDELTLHDVQGEW